MYIYKLNLLQILQIHKLAAITQSLKVKYLWEQNNSQKQKKYKFLFIFYNFTQMIQMIG